MERFATSSLADWIYLRKAIEQWFKYDNEKRIHESLDNLILRDICLWGGGIKKIRETIKQSSISERIFDNKRMKYQSK